MFFFPLTYFYDRFEHENSFGLELIVGFRYNF
jgi:hypothetical protein